MNTEQRLHQVQDAGLTNQARPRSGRAIAIGSGAAGVGKSSLLINLAVELARQNKEVCLLDTLDDVHSGNKLLEDVMFNGPAGISIIPASSSMLNRVSYDKTPQSQMIDIIRQLEANFDYILIDAGTGISESVLGLIETVPESVITITTDPARLKQAFILLRELSERGFDRPLTLVINRVGSFGMAEFTMKLFSTWVKIFLDLDIASFVHVLEDENVPGSISEQLPYVLLYPSSPAASCIRNLAYQLIETRQGQVWKLSEYLAQNEIPRQQPVVPRPRLQHQSLPIIRPLQEVDDDERAEPMSDQGKSSSTVTTADQIDEQTTVINEGRPVIRTRHPETHPEPSNNKKQLDWEADKPGQDEMQQDAETTASDNVDYLTAIHFASQLNQRTPDK